MVKQVLSMILAVVLVASVAGSLASGTMAGFFDTEVSTDNEMHAGTRILELSGDPITVEHAVPSNWYFEEYVLTSAGTLPGVAFVHIMNLLSEEAGTVNGKVYYGATDSYEPGSPVGAGVASSEPELVAEEGGQVGQITVTGLGMDSGDDNGPADMVLSKHIDAEIWFDKDGDGEFEEADSELIVQGKLFDIACQWIELGEISGAPSLKMKGGGWGSYFEYTIGSGPLELPLMVGQNWPAGTVTVSNDANFLYVDYDTTDSDWEMAVTHVWVGTEPPEKMAPGQFTSVHDPVQSPLTDLHTIPLEWSENDTVIIAAHAEGTDGETGWGKGDFRKFKIGLHMQQIEDPLETRDYDGDGDVDADDEQLKWWPTNALQGDRCSFDMEFKLETDGPGNNKK